MGLRRARVGVAASRIRMTERRWLYIGVGLPVLLGALDLTVISAVLPVIIGELDLVVPDGVRQASWLVIGYLVAYAIGIVGGGRLGDRYGSRRVLVWAVGLFGVASLGLIVLASGPASLVKEIAYRGFEARPDPSLVALAVLTGWRVLQALAAGAIGARRYGVWMEAPTNAVVARVRRGDRSVGVDLRSLVRRCRCSILRLAGGVLVERSRSDPRHRGVEESP